MSDLSNANPGGTLLYKLRFFNHFGLKKVIDFYRFDLKLGMFNALRPGVILVKPMHEIIFYLVFR